MDKSKVSVFTEAIRRGVLAGGTFLCMAHANKNTSQDGKVVYGGVSDLVDDLDCCFIINVLPEKPDAKERIVEFGCYKSRGDTAQSVAYAFSIERSMTYFDRVTSFYEMPADKFASAKAASGEQYDARTIAAIEGSIREGINTKMKIVLSTADRADVSQSQAKRVIEENTGDDPARHRWNYRKQAHGAMVYYLLDRPDGEPATAS